MINTLILLITITVAAYLFYRQYRTNKQLHNEITTNSEAVEELESNTYHSQSDIESMIEDGISNLQYDVDDHGTSISNLQDEMISQDDLEETKKNIEDSEHRIIEKVKLIQDKLNILLPDEEPEEDDKAEMAMEILEKHRDVFNNDAVKELHITLSDGETFTIKNEAWEVSNG